MTLLIPILLFLSVPSRAHPSGPPILSKPLTSQLIPTNPAISSAFLIPPASALLANASSPFPALRVPPLWSFSIGFSGATFRPSPGSSQKLSFSSQLDNGEPLPDWLQFAQDTITFGGITPKESHGIQVLKIVVTASAKSGMTTSDAFTLIVCPHDLSLTGPLLTRNVTANNPFSIVLNDWQGVQVDGAPPYSPALAPILGGEVNHDWISSSNSTNLSLDLDISSFPWLKYDAGSCTLSGTPPSALAGVPIPVIPAFVKLTFAQSTQYLIVSTNLTLVVSSPLFTTPNLPALSAPPGTNIAFALASFLTIPASITHKRAELAVSPISNVNVSAAWDLQDTTWLSFDEAELMLRGTVPQNALDTVQVIFTAIDEIKGTTSRTQMRIDVEGGGGDGTGRGILPTNTLRQTGKKIQLAVGVVFGVAAGVILLACLLAICRHCCVAREHVNGVYVIDQSACDKGIPYKSSLEKRSLEKHGYQSPGENGIGAKCLGPFSDVQTPASPNLGHTMTKAAFFDAMRTRFGSDGSWRPGRNIGNKRVASENDGSGNVNGSDHTGISFFGSSKRPRKSKISKPMIMLSSSTSIRDGFAERGCDGIGSLVKGKGKLTAGTNFTIFGDGNNAGTIRGDGGLHMGVPDSSTHGSNANIPPTRPAHVDISHVIGRVFLSSPGSAALAYDQSRSVSDPVRNSIHGSVGTTGSPGKRQSGSASAPSLGTGTHSGTQSTFATGDSTRLTNAAGEVPFRRPGFDGRWETLAERNLREATALAERSTGNVGTERSIGSPLTNHTPDPSFPPRALAKGSGNMTPASWAHLVPSNTSPGSDPSLPKSTLSTKPPTPSRSAASIAANTPLKSSKASTPSKSVRSKTASNKSSPLNSATSGSVGAHDQSGTPIRPGPASKLGSDRSLGAPSSYRKVFFGDKGNESDSSIEDVDNAVIKHVVNRNRNSSDTPVIVDNVKAMSRPGKPRLVAFTHERIAAASGQGPRRDVSQKAVLQGGEDSDPEAEMRIGLEYVRQLGDPDTGSETSHMIAGSNTMPSTSVSFAVDPTRTPSAEYYASNDSNHSIAGRTRVLAPLVISSHRNRHHVAQSMASTHDSFISLAERERELPRESRWMIEATLPRFTFSAKEPFNFAVPLDREHKHASALAGSALEAKQADGRPLPEWLRFDKGGKEFWGVTPNAAHGKSGELMATRVVVKIWDGEKSEVVGGCIVDVFGEKE